MILLIWKHWQCTHYTGKSSSCWLELSTSCVGIFQLIYINKNLHQETSWLAMLLCHPQTGKLKCGHGVHMSLGKEINLIFGRTLDKCENWMQPRCNPTLMWHGVLKGHGSDNIVFLSFSSSDSRLVVPLWRPLWASGLLIGWSSRAKEKQNRKQSLSKQLCTHLALAASPSIWEDPFLGNSFANWKFSYTTLTL